MTIDQLIEHLEAHSRFFDAERERLSSPGRNPFTETIKCVKDIREALIQINLTLCVPAAEYVPAIRDVFDILDELNITEIQNTKVTNDR